MTESSNESPVPDRSQDPPSHADEMPAMDSGPIAAGDTPVEEVVPTASLADEESNPENAEVVAQVAKPNQVAYVRKKFETPDIPIQFQNLAAKGGAITSLVLGVFSLIGIFFSQLSLFNACLGIAFGFWGLTSNDQWISQIGIGTCLVTVVLAMVWS